MQLPSKSVFRSKTTTILGDANSGIPQGELVIEINGWKQETLVFGGAPDLTPGFVRKYAEELGWPWPSETCANIERSIVSAKQLYAVRNMNTGNFDTLLTDESSSWHINVSKLIEGWENFVKPLTPKTTFMEYLRWNDSGSYRSLRKAKFEVLTYRKTLNERQLKSLLGRPTRADVEFYSDPIGSCKRFLARLGIDLSMCAFNVTAPKLPLDGGRVATIAKSYDGSDVYDYSTEAFHDHYCIIAFPPAIDGSVLRCMCPVLVGTDGRLPLTNYIDLGARLNLGNALPVDRRNARHLLDSLAWTLTADPTTRDTIAAAMTQEERDIYLWDGFASDGSAVSFLFGFIGSESATYTPVDFKTTLKTRFAEYKEYQSGSFTNLDWLEGNTGYAVRRVSGNGAVYNVSNLRPFASGLPAQSTYLDSVLTDLHSIDVEYGPADNRRTGQMTRKGFAKVGSLRMAMVKGTQKVILTNASVVRTVDQDGGVRFEVKPTMVRYLLDIQAVRSYLKSVADDDRQTAKVRASYLKAYNDSATQADAGLFVTVYREQFNAPSRAEILGLKLMKAAAEAKIDLLNEPINADKTKTFNDAVKVLDKAYVDRKKICVAAYQVDEVMEADDLFSRQVITNISSPWAVSFVEPVGAEPYLNGVVNGMNYTLTLEEVAYIKSAGLSTFTDTVNEKLVGGGFSDAVLEDYREMGNASVGSANPFNIGSYDLQPQKFVDSDGYPRLDHGSRDAQIRAMLIFKALQPDVSDLGCALFFTSLSGRMSE